MLFKAIGAMPKQRGSILLEALCAVLILGTIVVVFSGAMSTGLSGGDMIEEHLVARSLIRTQLEEIKNQPYNTINQYPVTVSAPSEYTVQIDVTDLSPPDYPDSLQKVAVTVSRVGKRIINVETLKANR